MNDDGAAFRDWLDKASPADLLRAWNRGGRHGPREDGSHFYDNVAEALAIGNRLAKLVAEHVPGARA